MAKLLTSVQMMAADKRTIEELGLPGIVLMENAGAGVVAALRERLPTLTPNRVLVIAGAGNNGGDGFVIARRLVQEGTAAQVLLLGRRDALKGDALTNYTVFTGLGGRVREIDQPEQLAVLQGALGHSGAVVDAVFGTGLQRPVTGLFAKAFEIINLAERPVIAVDLPSGVSADNGQVLGTAIRADWTVTFAAEKIGHRTHPGAGLCGEVIRVPIGIPDDYLAIDAHSVGLNTLDDLDVPPRPADGHKGSFGHLMILAGAVGKTGAAILTAKGAMRMGPGLVTVATPKSAQPVLAQALIEAMTLPVAEVDGGRCWDGAALDDILNSGVSPRALAIGPGMGGGEGAGHLVHELVSRLDVPAVIDADGLNLLAETPTTLATLASGRRAPLVLTPHPGEMARLVGKTVPQVQADRLNIAVEAARQWRLWLALKGAGTVIAAPDGRAWINHTGHAGMAAGGSGDLLTGIIAGLLAQGWRAESAVRAGVHIHGAAAEDAARGPGPAGMLAGDLLPHLQAWRNRLG